MELTIILSDINKSTK